MSAEQEGKRFSIENARARAKEAFQKSEFILSRAWGLVSNPKAEWEQIRSASGGIAASGAT